MRLPTKKIFFLKFSPKKEFFKDQDIYNEHAPKYCQNVGRPLFFYSPSPLTACINTEAGARLAYNLTGIDSKDEHRTMIAMDYTGNIASPLETIDTEGDKKRVKPLVFELAIACIDAENKNGLTPISLLHAYTVSQTQDTCQQMLGEWHRRIQKLHGDYAWKPACFIIDGAIGEFNVSSPF